MLYNWNSLCVMLSVIIGSGAFVEGMDFSSVAAKEPGGKCQEPIGPERRELLDGMRSSIVRDLRQPVQFKVRRIRVCGAWAFVVAEPIQPDGKTILWKQTICKGDVSHLVGALEYKDSSGKWALKDYALCPTDVAWEDWPTKYSAPKVLFAE